MVDINHMDVFVNACNQISSVKKQIYFKFDENAFVQSEHYCRPNNIFIKSAPNSSTLRTFSKHSPANLTLIEKTNKQMNTMIKNDADNEVTFRKTNTIILKNISHIFFNIINPIGNKADDIEAFCKTLDKYKYLLKTITSKHKQLHKQISDYVCSTNGDLSDMCHLNKSFITFWSKLLNCDIYIVTRKPSQYQEYLNSDQNKFIVIRFIEQNGYELMNTASEKTFEMFNNKFNCKPSVDISKLTSRSIKELRQICDLYKIHVGAIENKKADIIRIIKEYLSE